MAKYVIGLDFGTNSCRAVLVDVTNGKELATEVFQYPSGKAGVIVDPRNPLLARQNPRDYLKGIEVCVKSVLRQAKNVKKTFTPDAVIGIGIDTTGSSPLPVDERGLPLCFDKRFKKNPAAMVWLWKDHTSFAEAEYITETAQKIRPQYLAKIGGVYSSEWWWSKILHCKRTAPEVYNAAFSWMEICDWIPMMLIEAPSLSTFKRSVCAAGHKAMYNKQWGGLPDEEFLETLEPGLGSLRRRLYNEAYTADECAGFLSKQWAQRLGLSQKTAVAVGAFDAHMGAVGAGISPGTLVKILGTSTCDIMVYPHDKPLNDIPGVCGIVDGSVMSGYYGIEAGQSAVGDIFLWFVNSLVPNTYGKTQEDKFDSLQREARKLKPGESGLLALDWNNGNRTILVDVRLTGLLLGQTLHTTAPEIYRALIEATAFGALRIIDRIEEYGVKITDIINCGGLATKNPLLMQIYADVTGRPMKVSRSEQTPALGAAMFAAVAAGESAGGYRTIEEAKDAMTGIGKVYHPNSKNHEIYKKLYALYWQLHDAFGTQAWHGSLYNVMKELIQIRDSVRQQSR
ncbi:MAG: ribulokinase [Bacteroidetes bacterium]|nr:ribulokinase [Bacteroidota bacterium]